MEGITKMALAIEGTGVAIKETVIVSGVTGSTETLISTGEVEEC